MTSYQQMRRPLVGVVLSVVVGLALQVVAGAPVIFWLACSALFLAAGVLCRYRSGLIYIICGLLGAAHLALEQSTRAQQGILALSEVVSDRQEVIGTIVSDVEPAGYEDAVTFLLDARVAEFRGDWWEIDQSVRVYLRGESISVSYGDRLHVKGRYKQRESEWSEVDGTLSATSEDCRHLTEANFCWRKPLYDARRTFSAAIARGVGLFHPQEPLLQALLLGYRGQISDSQYALFSRTGSLHIFAISGLHVGVMVSFMVALLKMIGVPRPKWGLYLIPVLFAYVVATGMKSSAFRAFTMAAIFFVGPLLGRRPDSVSAIAFAALLLLVLDPLQVGAPGFLLSFTVVIGIVLVHREVSRRAHGFIRTSWADSFSGLSGPRPLRSSIRALEALLLTSIAAWLFSIPLTMRFFNTISFVAPFSNLAVIPLTFLIVLSGCLAGATGGIELFYYASDLLIRCLTGILTWIDRVPGSSFFVKQPSALVIGLWYAGWVLLVTGTTRLRKVSPLLLLAALLIWGFCGDPQEDGLRSICDGDHAVLIRTPGSLPTLLTDGDAFGMQKTVRLLKAEGVSRLGQLVVTDRRADPESIRMLAEMFRPQTVALPSGNVGFSDLIQSLSDRMRVVRGLSEWPVGQGSFELAR